LCNVRKEIAESVYRGDGKDGKISFFKQRLLFCVFFLLKNIWKRIGYLMEKLWRKSSCIFLYFQQLFHEKISTYVCESGTLPNRKKD